MYQQAILVTFGVAIAAVLGGPISLQDFIGYYPSDVTDVAKEVLTECVEMRGTPGIYQVRSSGDQLACGIYLVGAPDTQVEIEFLDFRVGCGNEALVGILDGWEQHGNVFPPLEDIGGGAEEVRQQNFCGPHLPKKAFKSSANMALIQYRLPVPGSGFMIRVSFHQHPKPCNFISPLPDGQLMLKNHGRRLNCSALIMYPTQLKLSFMDVGVTPHGSQLDLVEIPPTPRECKSNKDYVEVRGGYDIDVSRSEVYKKACGFHLQSHETSSVFCESTIIRMVSSGRYENTVIIDHVELQPEAVDLDTHICPVL